MKGITLREDFVSQLLGKPVTEPVKVTESVETEKVELEHQCPLCESSLSAPLSEEKLKEHVEFVVGIIQENIGDEDSEELDETQDPEDEDDGS